MNITQLIEQLESLRKEHGDIQVRAHPISYDGAEDREVFHADVYVPIGQDFVIISP